MKLATHPDRCSLCGNRHDGICPNALNFDPIRAVVERDAEIYALRLAVWALRNEAPAPAPVAPTPRKKARRDLTPGTEKARAYEAMSDGAEWTSARLAERLGVAPSNGSSILHRLAKDGWIERTGIEGNNSVTYRRGAS